MLGKSWNHEVLGGNQYSDTKQMLTSTWLCFMHKPGRQKLEQSGKRKCILSKCWLGNNNRRQHTLVCVAIGNEKTQFKLNCWAIHESYNEWTFEVQTILVISIIRQYLCTSRHLSRYGKCKAYKILSDSDGCWILSVCSSKKAAIWMWSCTFVFTSGLPLLYLRLRPFF